VPKFNIYFMKKLIAGTLLLFGLLFSATTHAQSVDELKSLMLQYGATSSTDSSLIRIIGCITHTTAILHNENFFVIDELFWIGNGKCEVERIGLIDKDGKIIDIVSFYKGRIIYFPKERRPTIADIAELTEGETPFVKDIVFLKNWIAGWMYNLTLRYKQ
jgi:hypothetical protein